MSTQPKSVRLAIPRGNLHRWTLGPNETGDPIPLPGGVRPTVQVDGDLHRARVLLLGGFTAEDRLVQLLDRSADPIAIDEPGMLEIPAAPALLSPEVSGGDEGTKVTITIFLPD